MNYESTLNEWQAKRYQFLFAEGCTTHTDKRNFHNLVRLAKYIKECAYLTRFEDRREGGANWYTTMVSDSGRYVLLQMEKPLQKGEKRNDIALSESYAVVDTETFVCGPFDRTFVFYEDYLKLLNECDTGECGLSYRNSVPLTYLFEVVK